MNASASNVSRFHRLCLASVLMASAIPALAATDYANDFKTVHQIHAGVLDVGYVDIGPRDSRSFCYTAGRTTSTAMLKSHPRLPAKAFV